MFHWSFYVCIAIIPILISLFAIEIVLFSKRNKIKIKNENNIAKYKLDPKYKKIQKILSGLFILTVIIVITAIVFAFIGFGNAYFKSK
ncbi:hypothetical protein DMC14_002550 [Metamycoplasma phocicerebrale]|uniref:Uncharacterized protein n=1 Tax=Metamycoplasma phocicerebrale TaxID=142649 RepID=A0A3Q9VBT7_9BACT|nr:hypothetical protein [Metamycoplasma phocicerebrale]AZZ65650.1 hypothetical protein DMC14_002550 [Metamycoplasma phocicerebrale]